MKFVLANWGTRGELEPYVTVGAIENHTVIDAIYRAAGLSLREPA